MNKVERGSITLFADYGRIIIHSNMPDSLSLWSLSAPIQLEVMPPTLTSHRGLQSLQPVHEAEVLECVLSVHLFLKSLPIAIIGL